MYHSVVKVKNIMVLSFSKLSFKVASVYMLPQSSDTYLFTKSSDMLKTTLGVKKCEANQKQHVSRQVRPKALISAEAKKLLYQSTFNSLNDILAYFHYWLVTWPPFLQSQSRSYL